MSDATPASPLKPGDVLDDKYEVERVLGAGGMGVVLQAHHVTLESRVAIKVLLPDVAKHPDAVERFLREARASINLRSQHVARVMDVGTLDSGAPYIVMEYLEGRDLAVLIRQAPVGVHSAVEYVLQAAEALAEAHAAGLVHRDLKPANLFLTSAPDGSALIKVLDFGISKAIAPGQRGITHTHSVMGSPGYMSPEQIRSAKYVDQRADIWGLGIVLYELLTSAPPFDGDNIATLSAQIVTEVPKRVDTVRSDVSPRLADVVERCLEKEPEQRYQSIAELAEALRPFCSGTTAALVDRIVRIGGGMVPYAATLYAGETPPEVAAETLNAWEKTRGRPKQVLMWSGIAVAALVAVLVGVFTLGRQSARSNGVGAEASAEVESEAKAARNEAARNAQARAEPHLDDTPTRTASSANNGVQVTPAELAPAAPRATASNGSASTGTPALASSAGSRAKRPPGRRVRRPIHRAKTECPAGQALSKGHCCPTGMSWQGTRCDRPLATSLP